MKVFLDPSIGLHSRAMVRISSALRRYLPSHLSETSDITEADLVVFYPIGIDWQDHFSACIDRSQRYAIVQCCMKTSGGTPEQWRPWWNGAECVWSYYDLGEYTGDGDSTFFNFYHAPLGIDPAFQARPNPRKWPQILTHGYVDGPGAERIMPCWKAAQATEMDFIHIGGWPCDKYIMDYWRRNGGSFRENITDDFMAELSASCLWVPSLREIEGFELPAAEALACGTRPVLFDQPDLRHWYGDSAVYVPEGLSDDALIDRLTVIFQADPEPVSEEERQNVLSGFSWEKIARGFWERTLS